MAKILRKSLAVLTILALCFTFLPLTPAFAGSQFVWWTEDGEGYHKFGANESITIDTGKMDYVTSCPVKDGVPDFIYPWTDIYIVPSGSVTTAGQQLEDVSGAPSTVGAEDSGGMFISETIGYTGPSGKVGPGKYALVFNECQNGKYDPQVDKLIDPAFEVDYPTSAIPTLDLSVMKFAAGKMKDMWEKYKERMEAEFEAEKELSTAENPTNEKFIDALKRVGMVDPRDGVIIQLGNLAKHYEGIAADPPDPNYQQTTDLGSHPNIDLMSNDPLDGASAGVGSQAANEQAITQAIWTSLERYQGAQAAGNGTWALTHAREIRNYAGMLSDQLTRTSNALHEMQHALEADTRPLDTTAAALEAQRSRIVSSGYTADETNELLSLGLNQTDINQLRTILADKSFAFTKSDMLTQISNLQSENSSFVTDLTTFNAGLDSTINTLKSDTTITDQDPVVNAGGPYTGNEGTPVSFSATASSPSGIAKYEWDLDGDGTYTDAQGMNVSYTYTHPYDGLVGLKVTDANGHTNTSFASVHMSDVNHPPTITSYSPSPRSAILKVGDSQAFGVTAADPENDAVTVKWYVDGAEAATGTSFTYKGTTAGLHSIEAVATDGSTLGGSVQLEWQVEVRQPIPASVQLSPGSATLEVGGTHHLTATVMDDQGKPAAGVSVTAQIAGANPGTLTAVTDSSGTAAFSYAGAKAGQDQITATAGTITSAPVQVKWYAVDHTPPVTTATLDPASPDGQDGKYASSVKVSLTATDDASGVTETAFRINGGIWKSFPGGVDITIAANGTYNIEYRSTDLAGNVEAVKTVSFTIQLPSSAQDTAAPVTTASVTPAAPNGGNGWYTSDVSVAFSAADDFSGVAKTEYRVDGGSWTEYSGALSVSADGAHVIDYRSTDFAGNIEAAKSVSMNIDKTKPVVTVSADPASPNGENGWYTSDVKLSVSADDAASGVAKLEYRIDGGSWTELNGDFALPGNGSFTVDYRATDKAGNAGDITSISVKEDKAKPVTTAFLNPSAPDGENGAYASDVSITLSATDSGSGIAATEYRLNGGDWTPYSGAISLTTNGTYTVDYRSKDQAGNVEDAKTLSLKLDKTRAPMAFFNPVSSGRNVALLESGATVVSVSSQWDGNHTPQAMLDYSADPYYPWATGNNQLTNQWVKFALSGGKTYLIDRVQVMPRIDYAGQRVKDFEVAVSTTTTDDAAFTTVLQATTVDNSNLQEFLLPKPVMAKYIKFSPLTRHGTDGCNCISTQQFKVNSGQEGGADVTFQNLSTDPDNDIVSWKWDFGDGATSTEQSPAHTFPGPGTYTVKLTATDSTGKTNSFSLTQTVLTPPAANFTYTPASPNEGQTVTFTDTSNLSTGSSILSRIWNWGDGSTPQTTNGSTSTITHSFPDNSDYTVTLDVVDNKGLTGEIKKTITPVNVAPTVDVGPDQWVQSGQNLSFSPTITDPGSRDTRTCKWDFGDGTSSTNCSFSHQYPALSSGAPDKTYTAVLTVTDKDGGVGTDSLNVTVFSPYINPGVSINNGDLFYTRYCTSPNVKKIVFSYDGVNNFNFQSPAVVASTNGADGLIFAPDGDLLVGGQGNHVNKVNPTTGATTIQYTNGGAVYHLALDKSGKKLWGSGIPGSLIDFPLDPFGSGTYHNITGDETAVTSIAFDSKGNAYYTNGGSGGYGSFGTIDLTTFKTTRLMSNVPAAHGMFFDSYTGNLILDGSNHISQIDPETKQMVSDRIVSGMTFDQGAADGKGHILVASNDGHMMFMDYSVSKMVNSPHNFVSVPFVESCMDDVAPLSGFGAAPPAAITLAPASASLVVGAAHHVTATVSDANGNTMAGTSVSLEVTGANPQTLTAVSDASGVASFSYTGSNPGTDNLVAKAATITSNTASVIWKLADTTPPVTTATLNPPAPNGTENWYTSAVSVTLTATDDDSGVAKTEYRINGGSWQEYSGPISSTSNGTYTLEYHSTDVAGNVEAVKSVSFKIDTGKPQTTASLTPAAPDGTGGKYSSAVSVALTAVDDLSGVAKTEYRINGGDWTVYGSPITVSDNGTYNVDYRSTDHAGNVEDAKSVTFTIDKAVVPPADTTPPATTAVPTAVKAPNTPDGWYQSDITVTLTATDDSSGVKVTEYRVNGGAWTVYTGPIQLTQEGTITLDFHSTDNAGNVEAVKSIVLKLDKTAPKTLYHFDPIFATDKSGTEYISAFITTLRAEENGSGSGLKITQYRINGGAWTTYTGQFKVDAATTHTVEYFSTDNAGNVENPHNYMDFDAGTFSGAGEF